MDRNGINIRLEKPKKDRNRTKMEAKWREAELAQKFPNRQLSKTLKHEQIRKRNQNVPK